MTVRPDTAVIRLQANRSSYGEHAVPIYATSGYVFDTAGEAAAAFMDRLTVISRSVNLIAVALLRWHLDLYSSITNAVIRYSLRQCTKTQLMTRCGT